MTQIPNMGPKLSDEDRQFIQDHHKCPRCKTGEFRMGPSVNVSFNVLCNNVKCATLFWLAIYQGQVVNAERVEGRDLSQYNRAMVWPVFPPVAGSTEASSNVSPTEPPPAKPAATDARGGDGKGRKKG